MRTSHNSAPLLPKLRGHFAEFLNHSSLDRLGILYLTTCVGLGYGPHESSLEAFLGSMGLPCIPLIRGRFRSHRNAATDLPIATGYTLTPVLPLTGRATLLRHPIAWLLPVRVPRSPAIPRRVRPVRAVSITEFAMGAFMRVREYQPVVHRLRLSASP
jgi:hypothetical protein